MDAFLSPPMTHMGLSVLTAIFSGEAVLASFIEAKGDRSGGDNCSYKMCKVPVKSSPPTNQHPMLYGLDALLVANQQRQSTEGK